TSLVSSSSACSFVTTGMATPPGPLLSATPHFRYFTRRALTNQSGTSPPAPSLLDNARAGDCISEGVRGGGQLRGMGSQRIDDADVSVSLLWRVFSGAAGRLRVYLARASPAGLGADSGPGPVSGLPGTGRLG